MRGGTAGKAASAPLLGLEHLAHITAVLASPERPAASGQPEPLRLSGIVATTNVSGFSLASLVGADYLCRLDHPDRMFMPPKRFSLLYPMEEKFRKKWCMPLVDAAISSMNSNLTCPVNNAQVFKDPADKKLESLLKASFPVAGSAVKPAVVAIGICQSLRDCLKRLARNLPSQYETAK